ncbi:MAG: hypothetical protein MK198_06865 [Gracilimonas sp.]|uniref:hypothetical protein n=1 Tax=Gracilimonas sp. TaxID=1974203 RepID=UPI003750F8BB|nr:hypothetical protein [Gracilimonas sp.]
MKTGKGKNKAKYSYTSLPKFEFKVEEDQGFIVHNDFPKFLAKLGEDDDLIGEIKWGDIAPKSLKEEAIRDMEEWYWHEFQDMPREN